MVWNSQFV